MTLKRRFKKTYSYQCTLTNKTFKMSAEAVNPNDLVSVDGYYQLHPEEDDRPAHIRKEVQVLNEQEEERLKMLAMMAPAEGVAPTGDEDELLEEEINE